MTNRWERRSLPGDQIVKRGMTSYQQSTPAIDQLAMTTSGL